MLWNIDPTHTSIEFSVRHLGIATVKGRFKKFVAVAEADENGKLEQFEAVIEAASIDTGVDQRDDHLRSADFLDVAKYPELKFVSTGVKQNGDQSVVTGELTLHGVTRPVTFKLEQEKPLKDPWGNTRIASTASGKLNRKDWGLNWNQALELGGVMVGEEVKFSLDIQVVAAQALVA